MLDKQAAVREFMLAAEQDLPYEPSVPREDVRELRVRLIAEELFELACATDVYYKFGTRNDEGTHGNTGARREPSLVDTADAIADLLYVVYGAAIAYGIDIDPVFAEVHRSNMTKFVDGSRREDGKYMRGPSYSPPNIARVLAEQGSAGT